MSFIAHKLKHRIQILEVNDEPNSAGGYTRAYNQLARIWAEVKLINPNSIISGIANVRGVNISDSDSHEFVVRFSSAVGMVSGSTKGLSREFDLAFSASFDSMLDTDPVKREYFIFLEDGAGNRTRGRLFKINRMQRDEVYKKFIKIKTTQMEEQGTGFAS